LYEVFWSPPHFKHLFFSKEPWRALSQCLVEVSAFLGFFRGVFPALPPLSVFDFPFPLDFFPHTDAFQGDTLHQPHSLKFPSKSLPFRSTRGNYSPFFTTFFLLFWMERRSFHYLSFLCFEKGLVEAFRFIGSI